MTWSALYGLYNRSSNLVVFLIIKDIENRNILELIYRSIVMWPSTN